MSTSFPLLKIARDLGRPYGEVIRMAVDVECRERLGKEPGLESYARALDWNADLDGPGPELLRAVRDALRAESDRRAAASPHTSF